MYFIWTVKQYNDMIRRRTITYVVYDKVWESFDIVYCGTDKTIATRRLNEGDQNRFMEVWVNGQYKNTVYGQYETV